MKRITSIFAKLALLFGVLTAHAEDITVVITPVQQILPPQALLYVANPGNYFNITLINSSAETKNVYLGMSVEQTSPSNSLSVSIPANRQPQQPIAVGPGQSRQLSLVEMKTLFNHVPMNEVKATPGLFDSYNNGSFGLLPEGIYKAQVIAYQWNPTLATPVALSSPSAGICNFTVCYKAQSPEFLTPMAQLGVATLSTQTPFFTWKQPIVACNPAAVNFTYTFRMVEMIPNQQPDVAIKNNAVFYEVKDLMTPMVTIPFNFVSRLDKAKTYAVQVTAKATGTGANQLNYVDIENDGKSNILMVKITSSKVDIPVVEEEEEPEPTMPMPMTSSRLPSAEKASRRSITSSSPPSSDLSSRRMSPVSSISATISTSSGAVCSSSVVKVRWKTPSTSAITSSSTPTKMLTSRKHSRRHLSIRPQPRIWRAPSLGTRSRKM